MIARRVPAVALTIVLAGTVSPSAWAQPGGGGGSRADRYLVVPFENLRHEPRLVWLTEGAAILVAEDLNAGLRRAYTREERLDAFDQLQVPMVASLSHATVVRLGRLLGATHVVIGSLALEGAELRVRAQNIRLDTGRMEAEVAESGPLPDLFGIFTRLTDRLAPAAGGSPAPADAPPPLPVFENYVKGLLASSPETKAGYLEAAVKLDPTFDRARLALWSVHHDQGDEQAALVAAAGVPDRSTAYREARFDLALSLIQLKRLDDAFATLKTLADRNPAASLLNNLGVIQLRRPATPEAGKATYYFNQALKLDPNDPDYYFNTGYAYFAERDAQGAIFWLREAVRRNPADGEAHALLAAALQSVGSSTEAARERELAEQLSARAVDAATRGLERLKTSLEAAPLRRLDSVIAESGQRDQRELALFHLDRGRRLFDQGSDSAAIAELRRALYLSPYEAEAHLLLGRIYLRTGQTQAAIDAFKISLWSGDSAQAHLGLAQAYLQAKNEPAARSEAQRALSLSPDLVEARALLDRLKP